MLTSESPQKVRWHVVAIVAAASVWLAAFGLGIYVNFGPARRLPSRAARRQADAKAIERREKLEERAGWQALLAAAERGDRDAMLEVAANYGSGESGAPHDETKAFDWLLRAARAQSKDAMLAVAERYEAGKGADKNIYWAIVWYERAAEAGDFGAARHVGDLFYEGKAVPRNDLTALRWYRIAADGGDVAAQRRVAEMREKGRGVERDLTGAFFDYARLAENGDVWSQNKVGSMLYFGAGVAAEKAEAVSWFRRAADQGNMLAVANLGVAYVLGEGVTVDTAEGRRLLQRAADSGDAFAVTRVADFYLRGAKSFARDEKMAARLLRRAAQLNDDAAVMLAILYLNGIGVAKDERRAFNDLKEIAARNSSAAKTELARIYLRGVPDVPADWAKARMLAEEAAADGYDPAIALHAMLLENGVGESPDVATATAQLPIAAENDAATKEILRDSLARAETPLDYMVSPPSAPAVGGEPLGSKQASSSVDRFPVPILRTPPIYPFDLRELGITGQVVVDFIVDREGTPQNVHAVSSTVKGFEPAAVAAVSQWRFKPGLKRGRPVPTHMQVPLVFTLNDDEPATAGRSLEAPSQ